MDAINTRKNFFNYKTKNFIKLSAVSYPVDREKHRDDAANNNFAGRYH